MSSTARGHTPDEGNWIHGCFTVKIGSTFKTFLEVVQYSEQSDEFSTNGNPDLDPNVAQVLGSVGGDDAALHKYFSLRKCRDTSLGGNDAINPLPQFGVDDDISHPLYYASLDGSVGMGQVYSENYDDTQQILYLGFGIPLFTGITTFWQGANDRELTNYINRGTGITVEKIGYLIGSTPVFLIELATIPTKWINAWVNTLEQVKISKYYSFSSQMPMYFRFVNTILVQLATNMNMVGSNADGNTTRSSTSGTTPIALNEAGTLNTGDASGLPDIFKNFGLDMAQIMTKRYLYENGKNDPVSLRKTDEAIFKLAQNQNDTASQAAGTSTTSTNPTEGTENPIDQAAANASTWAMKWIDQFTEAYSGAIYDGHLFIGFRIEKGAGASESFSNSTGESAISQMANSKFQEAYDARISTMDGAGGEGVLGSIISGFIGAARSVIQGVSDSVSLDALGSVMTGASRIDIPEVWMNSSYSRSASFNLTCLAPYGDFQSIFQSEYVPLACILAGVLPRATGHSSHSSPFVCQAYCRGIFSSPLSIIESVEVSRGADQFGFSAARLPLELNINITLKDLYPVMAINMGGNRGIAQELLGADDLFNEYMMTLSGMGLKERLSPFRNIRRKAQILLSTFYKNRLSPFQMGMEGGANFTVSRVISAIVSSGSSLPGN